MSQPGNAERRRIVAQAALAVGLVSAAFVVVMCALLVTTHIQLKKADPLNSVLLESMRERYAEGERTDELKQDIRQLDLLSRRAFFTSQKQIVTGGLIAVIAGIVMLVAFGIYQSATKKIPPPDEKGCEGTFWEDIQRSRVWIAGGTVVLVAVSVVMSLSTPTGLSPDLLDDPAAPPVSVDVDPEGPVFPEGFAENAPVFRGAAGIGLTEFEDVPVEWNEEEKVNIRWKSSIDLPGWASPVVWGDKVILVGAAKEQRGVYCLNAKTGNPLWDIVIDVENDGNLYTTDTLDERWDLLMYAGATPAVNGKQAFVMFSCGELQAFDLNTGDVLWELDLGETEENKYGLANSLLIYRDSVIVVFQGNEMYIARYDAKTGKQLWKTERKTQSWASPLLAKAGEERYLIVLPANPDVTAWDPETGRQVWNTEVYTNEIEWCVGPSPVQVGQRIFVNMQNCGIYGLNVSDGTIAWKLEKLPDESGFSDGPSMATDGRYLYQYYQSVLTCVDAETGKVIKQKETDEFANYASAVINRGSLYLCSDKLMTILDPDPESGFAVKGYGEITESADSTATFAKGAIYLRSDSSLYCIGVTNND